MGYSLWGCKESDTTEQLSTHPQVGGLCLMKMSNCVSHGQTVYPGNEASQTPLGKITQL